jgi:hypothetical protein
MPENTYNDLINKLICIKEINKSDRFVEKSANGGFGCVR